MTLRDFMSLKKSKDKDSMIKFVVFKLFEKIQQ